MKLPASGAGGGGGGGVRRQYSPKQNGVAPPAAADFPVLSGGAKTSSGEGDGEAAGGGGGLSRVWGGVNLSRSSRRTRPKTCIPHKPTVGVPLLVRRCSCRVLTMPPVDSTQNQGCLP